MGFVAPPKWGTPEFDKWLKRGQGPTAGLAITLALLGMIAGAVLGAMGLP